ncbi:nuclear hormone receptor FTZ-F1 isoform X2 [Drosophila hydei]|uniref:Nuclear hormone receptor FTZ-F1 isoform X2 n=1 Tax=Drosophila hydei TaxID=7224 RepID=A0A6J1L1I0_DROHY|nr:nuclear hormone receptor FTZ-F1 isoform X2 [Drosophila hydei]
MENFNVPLLAESSTSSFVNNAASGNNDSNNQHHQHLQQQQQLLPHHHKDQMLAAGSTFLPFINYTQLQKNTQSNSDSNPPVENFSSLHAIDGNQLDVAVSLGGLCDRIFPSPNPHSTNNNNHVDVKLSAPSGGNSGPVILESVTMSSFANILFNNRNNNNNNNNTNNSNNNSNNNNNNNNNQLTASIETLNSIDPLLLQKSNSVEYHQLKPLKNGAVSTPVVSTSGFLNSTTAQLLDFEVVPNNNNRDAIVAGSNGLADTTTTTTTTAAAATSACTVNRRSLHSIEELAASSCAATNVNTTTIITQVEQQKEQHKEHQHQQQHHQHHQQQQQQHQAGNLSGSNISSDDESISEDEFGLEIDDQGAVRADRMRGGRNKFGPMYKRDRARKLQVMRQRQLALQALRSSIGSDIKPTPLSPGYQQAYPNMNIKQEIQIPQVSSLTQSPDSSPSPIAIALGQVNAGAGGVIATPLNVGNLSGGSSLGNGSSNTTNNNSTGSSGGGGGSGGGNNAGGGSGANNSNNIPDGLQRNGNSGNSNSNSSCHETGNGSLQNTADSKLCFDSGTHPSSTGDAVIEPLRVSPMIREFVQSIDDREWQTQLFALLQKQTYNQVEVDLFELMCKVLDQNLFSQVDWARNTVFFKDLKVDDQMKLLQHSWSDMLVLDHLHHRIHNGLPDETQLNNGQVFNLMSLGLLGVPQLGDYFNELQNKLQDLKFDMGDYVCMKFLILLNPDVRGIVNKKTVVEGHENVQAALLDYTLTCYPSVNDKFRRLLNILPEIHAMAARGEEHLYSKHCAGSAPTQTLLMEMLHAKRKV